jgi:hypothetical protein
MRYLMALLLLSSSAFGQFAPRTPARPGSSKSASTPTSSSSSPSGSSCRDICAIGATRCEGGYALECRKLRSGCTDWVEGGACQAPAGTQQQQQQQASEEKKEEEKKEEKQEEKKDEGAKKDEPKLKLPIALLVWTAVFSGLGWATGFLSAGPERTLRNPDKHTTRDATNWVYFQANALGIISKTFYSASGAFGGFATFRTTQAVREYVQAKAAAAMSSRDGVPEAPVASAFDLRPLAEPESLELPALPAHAGFVLTPSGEGAMVFSFSY